VDVALHHGLDEVEARRADVEPQLAERDRRPMCRVDPDQPIAHQHRKAGEQDDPPDDAPYHRCNPASVSSLSPPMVVTTAQQPVMLTFDQRYFNGLSGICPVIEP